MAQVLPTTMFAGGVIFMYTAIRGKQIDYNPITVVKNILTGQSPLQDISGAKTPPPVPSFGSGPGAGSLPGQAPGSNPNIGPNLNPPPPGTTPVNPPLIT